MSPIRPGALTLALALPLLPACNDRPSGPPEVVRLDLAPLEPAAELPEPRTLARIELPEALDAWRLEDAPAELREGPPRSLLVQGSGQRRLTIPGPIPAAGCDGLWLELAATARPRISAHFVAASGATHSTELVPFGGTAEPERIHLGLRELLPAGEYEQLVLAIDGLGPVGLFGALELGRTPPALRLPAPVEVQAGALPLVELGPDQRRGRALAAGRPLAARARVPEGGVLRFASGLARGNDPAELATARLVVRVEAEGVEALEAEFPLAESSRAPWRAAELALERFAGREARLDFSLEGSPSGELACLVADARLVGPREDARTVLLVTSDTHRADHVGVARDAQPVRTPALDALAARGVWFEDCFTSTNVTNPSHMALLTGVHPRDHGVLDNLTAIAERADTLAERFADAGFTCLAALSVRHLDPEVSNLGQGFHCVGAPEGERPASATVAQLSGWLDERRGEEVFAWLHVFDVHGPYAPPPEVAAEVWPAGRDAAFDPALPPHDLPDSVFPPQLSGLRDLEYPLAMYRAEVDALDRELAALLDSPRVRDGIIALTADHGESLGEHGIFYSHAEVYPQSLHVPLILAWPDGPRGLRVEVPVRQIDVGRTLLDLAGLGGVAFPGRSLLPLVEGEAPPPEPRYAIAANRTSASLTVDGWHLVLGLRTYHPTYSVHPLTKHRVELFHLPSDPAAAVDLAAREPERARRMREQLVRWLTTRPALDLAGEVEEDADLARHLAALGYAESEEGGEAGSELFDPDCVCTWCRRFP